MVLANPLRYQSWTIFSLFGIGVLSCHAHAHAQVDLTQIEQQQYNQYQQ